MRNVEDLGKLLRQRTWDKELNLWVGSEPRLRSALEGVQTETLDLLDLFIPDQLPLEDDDVRQHLVRALRQKLQTIPRPARRRVVLVVNSAGLLARFNVGVREFYDWFCDDFSMAFLLIEGQSNETHWPDEVECDPDRLIEYFVDADLIKQQFGG